MCNSKSTKIQAVGAVLLGGLFGAGSCLPSSPHQQEPRQYFANPLLVPDAVAPQVACTVDAIAAILKDHSEVSVTSAQAVAAGGTFAGSSGLPALCAVKVNVKSSSTTGYNFGLYLPDTTWSQRFIATGNNGLSGGIQWGGMARFSKYGFASMSTDTGHDSAPGDASWGLNNPESVIDWGYRAMHGSIVLSKEIIAGYYSDELKYSYYASCSTGGRQGLKEVQYDPNSFDGILIGAAAWWLTHLSSWTLWVSLYNYPDTDPGHINSDLFYPIFVEQLKQCDPQDGLTDSIISSPENCNFNFTALLCTSSGQTSCLTAAQLGTVQKFYSDWVADDGTFVFPVMSLGASPRTLLGSVQSIGYSYFQNWVYNDSNWDYTKMSYADVQVADRIDPGQATAGDFAAMGTYFAKGGKVIMYHGDADDTIPAKSSVYFYNQLKHQLGALDNSYRLFMVPSMGHCGGSASGDAPWYFSAGSQSLQPDGTYSVPGFEDADHDAIFSLIRWVEKGQAPDQLIASKFKDDKSDGAVVKQRPLCPYPKRAKYTGTDPNSAASFSC